MNAALELVRAIEADPRRARALLEGFVSRHSFPIVDDRAATFFFWDDRPTDEVILIHWVFGLEGRQPFHRIPHTNAFYLQVDLPEDARVEYKLEIHRGGRSAWLHDPRNPHRAHDPFGSNSVCPMPRYREPFWLELTPETRRGTLEEIELHSEVYGGTKTITVYKPAWYRPSKTYPLVICHDGRDYLRYAQAKDVLDSLIHRHEVHPVLVAFTTGYMRNQEYGADPRQPDFLVHEVLPLLESRYSISPDPKDRALMGASFGGVTSLFSAWTHPGVFGQLLLQSGSFVFTDVGRHGRGEIWDPVVAFVNQFRREAERLEGTRAFMSCGTFESLITYNRSLVPLMRKAGIEVRFVESRDGHNWIAWRDRLREGLSWLFPGHLWMYYE